MALEDPKKKFRVEYIMSSVNGQTMVEAVDVNKAMKDVEDGVPIVDLMETCEAPEVEITRVIEIGEDGKETDVTPED
jgi:hypothetical protein